MTGRGAAQGGGRAGGPISFPVPSAKGPRSRRSSPPFRPLSWCLVASGRAGGAKTRCPDRGRGAGWAAGVREPAGQASPRGASETGCGQAPGTPPVTASCFPWRLWLSHILTCLGPRNLRTFRHFPALSSSLSARLFGSNKELLAATCVYTRPLGAAAPGPLTPSEPVKRRRTRQGQRTEAGQPGKAAGPGRCAPTPRHPPPPAPAARTYRAQEGHVEGIAQEAEGDREKAPRSRGWRQGSAPWPPGRVEGSEAGGHRRAPAVAPRGVGPWAGAGAGSVPAVLGAAQRTG